MTSFEALQSLASSYPPPAKATIIEVARGYERRNQQEALDVAAIAANVTAAAIVNLDLEPEIDPLLMKAFRLQYPNVDPGSLLGRSQSQLEGFANGIKGKYFEVLVEARLNHGDTLGELHLEVGQIARIAESPTQAGWDLEIVRTHDGSTVELIQLKATTSLAYIKQALIDYPDIRIAAPSEVDGLAQDILRTDITHADLEYAAQQQVGELAEGAVPDLIDQATEFAFDSLPIVPAVLVATIEGRKVILGRSSIEEALQRSALRMRSATAFSVLGATLAALDAGIFSIPATTAARVAWGRFSNRIATGNLVSEKAEELRSIGSRSI
jgi:hypothetical protein